MLEYFNGLDSYSKFYFVIAAMGTVIFLFKLLLMFVGGDSDFEEHTNDLDMDFDHDTSFTFLSTQSILAFLMGAGWIGLAAKTEWEYDNIHSIIFAAIAGFIAMFLMAFLMTQVKKLNKTAKNDISGCMGAVGKAYTKFAPRGSGQIQVDLNGKMQTIDAVNNSDEEIPSFMPITVVGVENNMVLINKK